MRLSRGTAQMVPQGSLDLEGPAKAGQEEDLVQKAFTVLTRKDGIAKQLTKRQASAAACVWPMGMPRCGA